MQLVSLFAVGLLGFVLVVTYRMLSRHPGDVFAIMIYLCTYFFIARPLVIILGIDDPFPAYLFGDFWPQMIEGLMLLTLYFIAIVIGAGVGRGPAMLIGRAFPKVDILPKAHFALYFSSIFAVISLLITLMLLAQYGSFAGIMHANKVEKALAGSFVLKMFGTLSVYLSVITLLLCVFYRHRGIAVSRLIAPLAFIGFAIGVMSTYAWGSRFDTAMGLLALGMGYLCYRDKFSWLRIGAFGAVLMSILVGMRFARDVALSGRLFTIESAEGNIVHAVMVSNHGVYFDAFMLLLRDVGDRIPYRWGQDHLYGLLGIIPRALWEGKPSGTELNPGAWFRIIYEPHNINGWPFTTPGEWLVNFGVIGVLLGGFLAGVVYRALQMRNASIATNPIALVFSVVYAGLMFDHGVNTLWIVTYAYFIPPMFVYMITMRYLGGVELPQPAGLPTAAEGWQAPPPVPRPGWLS